MERLTTNNPQNNFETMMNYATAKDGEVILRNASGEDDVPLVQVLAQVAAAFDCETTAESIGDGLCMGCCACPVDALMAVGVQAVELRHRLQMYEDTGLTPNEIVRLRNPQPAETPATDPDAYLQREI